MKYEYTWYVAEMKQGWYHTVVRNDVNILKDGVTITDNIAMAKRYHKPPNRGTPVKVKCTYELER